MIQEYILKKVLDTSLELAKKALEKPKDKKLATRNDLTLLTTRDDLEDAINYHLQSVKNWSAEVSFSDLKRAKRTTEIFIELDLFVYPRRIRIDPDELVDSIPLKGIFDRSPSHIVLLGHPGAGKTTSMKYLCQLLFYEDSFQSERFAFPILIRFRDFNSTKGGSASGIIEQLFKILCLKVDQAELLVKSEQIEPNGEWLTLKERLVIRTLEGLNALIILEGFDELAQYEFREKVIEEIQTLATHLERSTLIVTSRTGDFVYNIENTEQYELRPLNGEQIFTFAVKWLNDQQAATDLLKKIYDSPFSDTAIRPLNLAHLCAIYERIGKIPEKPKTIYRKIVNLLLEEWDQQRSIKRPSRYAKFEIDRKNEFLSHLAFTLTASLQKTIFSKQDLLKVYSEIYHDYALVSHEAHQVVNELETHTGLFIQSGYEEFEFAHKSLQEFLAAEYLVKLPSIPQDVNVLSELPNELSIAVAISSNPSEYISELVFNRLINRVTSKDFPKAFISRLLLEKPDFNLGIKVSLSLLVIYSIHVEHNSSPHEVKDYDSVMEEFEETLSTSVSKTSIDLIREGYTKEYTYNLSDNRKIYRMVKKLQKGDKWLENLPKILFILNTLIPDPAHE